VIVIKYAQTNLAYSATVVDLYGVLNENGCNV